MAFLEGAISVAYAKRSVNKSKYPSLADVSNSLASW